MIQDGMHGTVGSFEMPGGREQTLASLLRSTLIDSVNLETLSLRGGAVISGRGNAQGRISAPAADNNTLIETNAA